MMRRLICAVALLSLCLALTFLGSVVLAGDVAPPVGSVTPADPPPGVRCAECGMMVKTETKASAQILPAEGPVLFFCDVGDMLYHHREKLKAEPRAAFVQDFETGAWLDAREAHYVKDETFVTPMGWGIAAFAGKGTGSVGFTEALELAR